MHEEFTYKIITTEEEFQEAVSSYKEGPIAVDVETHGKDPATGHLLGVSISYGNLRIQSIFIPGWVFFEGVWSNRMLCSLHNAVKQWLSSKHAIGHNFTYDKRWLFASGISTNWTADTRLMWHMASAPTGPRPYGLKDAQKELLGWSEKGDQELKREVEAKGGKLSNGDHYLASVDTLGKYACLDTYATLLIYHKLAPTFDGWDYWPLLSDIMAYNELLEENTYLGVPCDRKGLEGALKRITGARDAAKRRLDKQLASSIAEIEHDWADRRIAAYKRQYNKDLYAAHPEKWERFNWNSDNHKRELFYDKLKNPVVYLTEAKKPATDADSVKQMQGDWTKSYLKYEHFNTLVSSFLKPYLASVGDNGILRPGFNICGTVSYRLSGFKPYLLNAPFDEKVIMKHFCVPQGSVGIHSDLSAIEPTITAHYSEDPYLTKVFGKGLGDIYLDLALELFPNDKDLQMGYDPNIPITKRVKEAFEKQRKIAKVIQLAVQYTGTGTTVARNLTKMGIPTSKEVATGYVKAYWAKFRRVAQWGYQLKEVNRRNGLLRNVIGRVIRVPDPEYKDLMNRFVQSSAHDCLIKWILNIDKLRKERSIDMRPILIDCHDSTSWCVREDQKLEGRKIFDDALKMVNDELELSVTIKAETKYFKTMAGLKGEE